MRVHCHYCDSILDPDHPATWRRIEAWERKSHGGSRRGGSDVAVRTWKRPESFACEKCVRKLQKGVAATQQALL